MKNPVFLLMVAILFICGCGQQSSNDRGASAPSGFSKIYFASISNEVCVLNADTLSEEASVVFAGANSICSISVPINRTKLFAVDNSFQILTPEAYMMDISTGRIFSAEVDAASLGYLGSYIASSPDGKKLYVPTAERPGIFIFSADQNLTLEAAITFEGFVRYGAMSAVTEDELVYFVMYLLTPGPDPIKVVRFDPKTKKITGIATIEGSRGGSGRLKMNPYDGLLYLVDYDGGYNNKIYGINKTSMKVVSSFDVRVNSGPWDIDFINEKAYVSCFDQNTVNVIDMASRTVTATVTGEYLKGPEDIIADRLRGRVYVGSYSRPLIVVIDPSTDTIISTIEFTARTDQSAVMSKKAKLIF